MRMNAGEKKKYLNSLLCAMTVDSKSRRLQFVLFRWWPVHLSFAQKERFLSRDELDLSVRSAEEKEEERLVRDC